MNSGSHMEYLLVTCNQSLAGCSAYWQGMGSSALGAVFGVGPLEQSQQ